MRGNLEQLRRGHASHQHSRRFHLLDYGEIQRRYKLRHLDLFGHGLQREILQRFGQSHDGHRVRAGTKWNHDADGYAAWRLQSVSQLQLYWIALRRATCTFAAASATSETLTIATSWPFGELG